jgi:hypothetical protein
MRPRRTDDRLKPGIGTQPIYNDPQLVAFLRPGLEDGGAD